MIFFVCFVFIKFFYKIVIFFLYLSILISIKLSLQLRKKGKEPHRDSVEEKSCLINTVYGTITSVLHVLLYL